jgi:hypothetical protein
MVQFQIVDVPGEIAKRRPQFADETVLVDPDPREAEDANGVRDRGAQFGGKPLLIGDERELSRAWFCIHGSSSRLTAPSPETRTPNGSLVMDMTIASVPFR